MRMVSSNPYPRVFPQEGKPSRADDQIPWSAMDVRIKNRMNR